MASEAAIVWDVSRGYFSQIQIISHQWKFQDPNMDVQYHIKPQWARPLTYIYIYVYNIYIYGHSPLHSPQNI